MNWNKIFLRVLAVCLCVIGIGLHGSPVLGLDRDAAFRYPVRAYNDGNYRVAIRGFNQFLGEYPDDSRVSQIQFWKAEAHMQLDDLVSAYDILQSLHENRPMFQQQEVLIRLSHLADQLDRQDQVIDLFSTRTLSQFSRLQNYLVKWRLDKNQPQELFSELSLIREQDLTDTSRDFLEHYSRSKTVETVQERLFRGQWDNKIWQELRSLPTVTRKNLISLGARNLWDNESFQTLVRFGEEVPAPWQTPEFKLYFAEASVEQNNLERAESIYRDLLEQPKYRAQTHFSLAWVLYEQGKNTEAKQYLEQVSWGEVTEPFAAEAVRLLGDIRLEENDLSGARSSYRSAIQLSDNASFRNQTRYWLGWAYFESGNIRKAYRAFNNVSAEGEIRLSDVYQARGRTSLEIGRYEEAEENYRQALRFAGEPDRKRTLRYELAQTLYEQGRMEEAFDRLLQLSGEGLSNSLATSVDMALARTALEMGEYDLSWSILRGNEPSLRKQFPREYLYFAGSAALEVGQLDAASDLFEELLRKHPNSPFARVALRMNFQVQLQRSDLSDDEQRRRLRETIEQSPADMRLVLLRRWADTLIDRGSFEEARTLLEEVLLKANDPAEKGEAIDQIVSLELERNRPARAFSFVENRFDEFPGHPSASQAIYRLIRHDYQRENLDRLNNWITRYFQRFRQSPYHGHVHFMAGEVARNSGDVERARDHYEQSLNHDPNPDIEARARYRLADAEVEQGDYSAAIPNLEELTGQTLDFLSDSRLNSMLAEAYFETGQTDKALDRLEAKSDRTDYDNLILAKIHFDRGELSETQRYLGKMNPPERSVLRAEQRFLQGRMERKKGNLEQAESIWYETLYLYPDWPDLGRLIHHLSDLLQQQGNTEEAQKLRQRLQEEFPNRSYGEERTQ